MDVEEKKLWELYKRNGRPELQEKIVLKYLKIVHYISKRLVQFTTSSLDVDDLYSAGVMGLLDAIERFDLEKNVEFKTYATLRVKGAIIDEIRRFDWVPRTVRKKSKLIDSTIHRLFSELNRLPSDEEIATELDITLDEYYQLTDNIGPLYLSSLDEVLEGEKGDMNFGSVLSNEQSIEIEENKQQIRENLAKCIKQLPERERLVITLYYYENMQLKEIGAVLEVTESRVSQIHSSAISKLRSFLQRNDAEII